MQQYQQQFIEFALSRNVLKFGNLPKIRTRQSLLFQCRAV